MLDDSTLTYSTASVDQEIEAAWNKYKVVASGASIYDVITSGGVKLTLVPKDAIGDMGDIYTAVVNGTTVSPFIQNESKATVFDFISGTAMIRDLYNPSLDFVGDVNDVFTYSLPSPKYVHNRVGELELGTTIRCDYNPETLEPLGVLNEPADTNFLLHSQNYANAWWTKQGVTLVPDAGLAPDGTMTASLLTEDTANTIHRCYKSSLTLDAGPVYNSVYIKWVAGEHWILLSDYHDAPSKYLKFHPKTGVLVNSVGVTANVVTLKDGWYRLEIEFNGVATGNGQHQIQFSQTELAGVDTAFTGDGVSSVLIWGSQKSSRRSSYIPTESSQVTRAHDNIQILLSNLPIDTTQPFTFIVDGEYVNPKLNSYGPVIRDGGDNNSFISVYTGNTSSNFYAVRVRNNNVDYATINSALPKENKKKISYGN